MILNPRIPLAFFRTPRSAELDGFFVDPILPVCCWHVTEISGAPPRLPAVVWTFRLFWRADVSDSKATVTDQLCAIPVWLRYDMLQRKEHHGECPCTCVPGLFFSQGSLCTVQNSLRVSRDGEGWQFIRPVMLLKVLL